MAKIQLISRDEVFEIGDPDCLFGIRRIHPDILSEIRRRHTRRIEPPGPGEAERWETDEVEVGRDLLDYIIQYWRGVMGPDGQEALCIRENKLTLPASVKGEVFTAAASVNLQGDSSGPLRPLKIPPKKASAGTP
jgi:hypothetical protein